MLRHEFGRAEILASFYSDVGHHDRLAVFWQQILEIQLQLLEDRVCRSSVSRDGDVERLLVLVLAFRHSPHMSSHVRKSRLKRGSLDVDKTQVSN